MALCCHNWSSSLSYDFSLLLNMNTNKWIVLWLLSGCFLIFTMVVGGGITRLTDSGLSMVNWHLFMGAIPPLNEFQWEEAFNLYKEYPEEWKKTSIESNHSHLSRIFNRNNKKKSSGASSISSSIFEFGRKKGILLGRNRSDNKVRKFQ